MYLIAQDIFAQFYRGAYGGAMTFDMSALKRGVYLCRIQNKTYKIVKR